MYPTGRSTFPFVCARYGRHARTRNPQWLANRKNSAFRSNSPPDARRSSMTTDFIWSNSNSRGTPPKYANADSRPRINTSIVSRR